MAKEPIPAPSPGKAAPRSQDGPQDVPQTPAPPPGERAALATYAAKMLDKARSQLGYKEASNGHTKYGQWYADKHHDPAFANANWCDMGLSWCAAQIGAGAVVGEYAYVPWHGQWFKDHGRFGSKPHPGDLVFYDWDGGHSISGCDHIGIVESVRSDGRIVTIEFNTSDAVMRRVRNPSGIVVGYGSPNYTSLEDDTAEVVSLGAGSQQRVDAAGAISVVFHTEYSDKHDHHGPDGYSVIVKSAMWAVCAANVQITGFQPNDPVDVSWTRVLPPKTPGGPWTVGDDAWRTPFRAGPDGVVRAQLGGQLTVDSTNRLRLRVYNPNAYPVTVTSAMAKISLLRY